MVDISGSNFYINGYIYFVEEGGSVTDEGTIRIGKNGNDLCIWVRESSSWIEIWRYSA